MNLISLLKCSVKKYSNKIALVDASINKTYTYSDLFFQIKIYALFFQDNKIKKGMRIAILLDNSIESIAILYSILYIGAIPVLIDFKFTKREIKECLEITKTKVIIYSQQIKNMNIFEELIPSFNIKLFCISCAVHISNQLNNITIIPNNYVSNSELVEDRFKTKLILFSYRGYGYPLAVVHDEKSIMHSVIASLRLTKSTSNEILPLLLPLSHIFSLITNIFSPLSIGARVILFKGQTPRIILQSFNKYKINFILAVPTLIKVFIHTIKKNKIKLLFLKKGIVGGDILSKDLLFEFRELTGCNLVEGFGLTETCPIICNEWSDNKVGSIGKPMYKVKIKILNKKGKKSKKGILYIKSQSNLLGYFNNNKDYELLMIEDWFNTGDIVELDEDGFLYFQERDKAIVKIGGSTVDIVEVKEVIGDIVSMKYKKYSIKITVKEDYLWNQKIICDITIYEKVYQKKSLISFIFKECKKKLASYKIPKKVVINT